MLLAGRFLIWRSEQESNPHWQYRKLQSYPLNDRSILFPEDREMNRSNYSVSGDGFQPKKGKRTRTFPREKHCGARCFLLYNGAVRKNYGSAFPHC